MTAFPIPLTLPSELMGRSIAVDPKRVRRILELKHTSPLMCCRFDPSGRFVFAGGRDHRLVRWSLSDKKKTVFTGHQSWVWSLAFHPKEPVVYSGGYDGRLLFWPVDADSPKPVRAIPAHDGWLRAVAVSPDGKLVATCGNDNLVKVWSTADGKCVRELIGHTCHVYNVAFHPKGELVSADHLGVVKQWDLANGKVVRELDAKVLSKYDGSFRARIGGVRRMTFDAKGEYLACAGITDVTNAFAGVGKPLIVLFRWKDGKRQLLRPKQNFQGTAWGVVFHHAGFIAAVGGGNGGMMWFWKLGEDKSFHQLKLKTNARDLDLHPDRRRLAAAFYDGAVRLYDLVPKAAKS